MNSDILSELKSQIRTFDENQVLRSRFKMDVLERLIYKLKNDEHPEIESDLQRLSEYFPHLETDINSHKGYFHILKRVKLRAKKRFGYVERGTLKRKDIFSWGVTGVLFAFVFESYIGEEGKALLPAILVGVPMALGIGLWTGDYNERMAEKRGLIY